MTLRDLAEYSMTRSIAYDVRGIFNCHFTSVHWISMRLGPSPTSIYQDSVWNTLTQLH